MASVSVSYPIGVVMLLETGGQGVRFKPRPVEGCTLSNGVAPDRLILDGQQRLTAIFEFYSDDLALAPESAEV